VLSLYSPGLSSSSSSCERSRDSAVLGTKLVSKGSSVCQEPWLLVREVRRFLVRSSGSRRTRSREAVATSRESRQRLLADEDSWVGAMSSRVFRWRGLVDVRSFRHFNWCARSVSQLWKVIVWGLSRTWGEACVPSGTRRAYDGAKPS
jgi:hypothetical protein